jgi:hypothetical protein
MAAAVIVAFKKMKMLMPSSPCTSNLSMQIDEVSDAKDVVRGQDANSRKQKSFK